MPILDFLPDPASLGCSEREREEPKKHRHCMGRLLAVGGPL